MPIVAGLGSPEVPDWAPELEHVADYLPHRTLVRSRASVMSSQDEYRFTWDNTTTPTGWAVSRLVGDGVAWVAAQVRPMNVLSYDAARVCAILYACAAIERSWPDDDQSLQRANDIEKRLDGLITALVASNALANDGDGVEEPGTAGAVLPVWSFPAPDPRFDAAGYF